MYMSSSSIDVKVVEPAGTIVLNRPDHGNALTRSMVQQLVEALDDLYLEKRVRAIILTGAGRLVLRRAPTWRKCARAQDLDDPEEQWGADAADFRDLLVRMLEITKPIIAAVHGPALAGGAALVAACDIVVASDAATFGLPDARHGMVAGLAAPLVSFRVGAGHAARLLLTGETIDAAEARRIGLFHELTTPDMVWARAMEMAEQCAAGLARGDPAHEAADQRDAGRKPGDAALGRRRHDGDGPHHRSRGRRTARRWSRAAGPSGSDEAALGRHACRASGDTENLWRAI